MSLRQWNTSFERKQLAKITTSLALYQANIGTSEMEEDGMSGSSSSSASSSSASSSSSSSASDMDLDQTTLIDPVLLKLIVTTTNLNEKINGIVADDGIDWGSTPTITDLSESDAIANCRLRKVDLRTLTEKLWPLMSVHLTGDRDKIKCFHCYTIDYKCGFIILLYRLSRPRRVRHDMEKIFGIRRSRLSAIIRTFADALYKVAYPYLNNPGIWHSRMPYFADLIRNKTDGVAENIWGFIDGTIRKTSRPLYHQRVVYTRFKKCHGLKFQSGMVPDGFIACLFGPVPAKTHDAKLLCESELLDQLEELMPPLGNSTIYTLYGALAYAQSMYLIGGFRNATVGTDEALYNRIMSSARISVEWGFGAITEEWKFVDFRQSMKIFECPVAQYYVIAAFLCNLRNCLVGSKTQLHFNAQQLTIDEYLGLISEDTDE